MHTFTQLVRMKVFYFLAVFAVIALASNFLDLPQHDGPEAVGSNVLRMIKSWSLGTMTLFSVVLSIVATALLLPKDVEDRTLYTILAKPVPRFDYLAGKLLGVLALVFVSLLAMDILMTAVLHFRTLMVMEDEIAYAVARGHPQEYIDAVRAEVAAQGPTWSLQGAVLALFIRSAIIASLALMISTFSTSTLFTTIISILVYFIGHFQADAVNAYFNAGTTGEKIATGFISLVLPNFQLFNVIDAVIEGSLLPPMILLQLAGIGAFYTVLYTLCSWFIFSDKEF
jgi:ABC-type transport system involved in multi-copper enzyme maturation permease subunit